MSLANRELSLFPRPARPFSQRALTTPPSPIRRLAPLAAEAQAKGTTIIPLNIGQPDIIPPPQFAEGFQRALAASPVIAYEHSQGSASLRASWSAYLNRSLGLETTPEQFLITMGASEALIFLFMVCADPGDEIIVFDPSYANYISFAAIVGVRLVPVACDESTGFHLPSDEEIEAAITPRTRAVVMCNPNNPTGTVYTEDEIRRVLVVCEKHGLYLISDETYREFVYDDRKPCSALMVASQSERVLVVDSLSKRYSLCGARIGTIMTANREVIRLSMVIAQARLSCPTLEQEAARYLLDTLDDEYVTSVIATYEKRRRALHDAVASYTGLPSRLPEGAFYQMLALPVRDAEHFCSFLLSEFSWDGETIFLAPADGFYIKPPVGQAFVRMAYVIDEERLERGGRLLGEGIVEYQRRFPGEFG
jgi:aspartate aminotransferase